MQGSARQAGRLLAGPWAALGRLLRPGSRSTPCSTRTMPSTWARCARRACRGGHSYRARSGPPSSARAPSCRPFAPEVWPAQARAAASVRRPAARRPPCKAVSPPRRAARSHGRHKGRQPGQAAAAAAPSQGQGRPSPGRPGSRPPGIPRDADKGIPLLQVRDEYDAFDDLIVADGTRGRGSRGSSGRTRQAGTCSATACGRQTAYSCAGRPAPAGRLWPG